MNPPLLDSSRYLFARLFTPRLADFVDGGLGIAARHRRCKADWEPHLLRTRAFLDRHCAGGGSLAVLGAGRLLDLDPDVVFPRYDRVTLYDRDPVARGVLRRVARRSPVPVAVDGRDLTGCLDRWTDALRRAAPEDPDAAALLLRSLRAPDVRVNADTVVSLNVLGQLGVYWEARVEKLLASPRRFPRAPDGGFDPPVGPALCASRAELERGHLRLLARSGAARLVVVTDTELVFYRERGSVLRTDPALGVDPGGVEGYVVDGTGSWQWDVAPAGREYEDFGVTHRVSAFAYTKAG